jgi:uncharacterized protein (DUF2336 family)
MIEKLSQQDVEVLTKSKDVESKIEVINKISGQYRDKAFTGKEQGLAEEIFRLLMRYAEIGVRKSIAENLMSADFVPRDILLSLAKDIDDVSRPILEFSELLTDDDLIDIVSGASSMESQLAVSRRNSLSESVSAALVNTERGEVVGSLLENSTAQISESSLVRVIDSFSNKEEVIEALVTRGSIPSELVVQLTKKVSTVIRAKLEKKYNCSLDKISNLFAEGGEIAAFRFGNMKLFGNDLIELINMLEANGQMEQALDPLHGKLTFILNDLEPIGQFVPISAVALGNKTMFEICMCRIAGVKYSNVSKLISDLDIGLKALYEKAGLPEPLFDAVRFAIHVINGMDEEAKKFGTARARDNLHEYIKHLITQSKGKKIRNLSGFISIIRKHIERSQGEW